jgi:hypothetical protein
VRVPAAADKALSVTITGERADPTTMPLERDGERIIVDVGSAGQPRNSAKLSTAAILELGGAALITEFIALDYDHDAYRREMEGASLSPRTKERLLSYFP